MAYTTDERIAHIAELGVIIGLLQAALAVLALPVGTAMLLSATSAMTDAGTRLETLVTAIDTDVTD